MTAEIRQKYTGLQTRLKRHERLMACMGDYSCLFLCLCSIAEEWLEAHGTPRGIDMASFALQCREALFIDDEWTCRTEQVLELATGVPWKKAEVKQLPAVVPDEMYTVEKWFNPRTGFTHFRRRWGDTLDASVTVREGALTAYYTFTAEGKDV